MKRIYQRDFKDCGVTCLSYIIQYYKGYVPIEKLREDTYTDKEGCTAYDLVETLKKYNFDSLGKRIVLKDLSELTLPVIAHLILDNGLHHFVVITNINKKYITIMDPSFGKKKYLYKEFHEIWDGIVLLAIPKSEIPKLPKEKNVMKILWELTRKETKLLTFLFLFNILVVILTIISSFYLKIGLNGILKFADSKSFFFFVLSFGILTFIKLFLSYGKDKISIYLNKNIELTFMYSFLNHLLKIPLSKLETYQEGEILTRIEETKEIKNLYSDICITFFLESLFGIVSLFILYSINTSLFLILIGGMTLYLLLGFLTSKPFFTIVLKNMESEVSWKSNIMENLNIIETMKHLNAYSYRKENMEEALCKNINLKLNLEKKILRLQFLKNHFLEFLFFFFTTYGLYSIYHNNLTLIDLITFQNLYLYFVSPIKELVETIPKFYYMKGIIIKISEFAAIKVEKIEEINQIFPIGPLKINDISYSYNSISQSLSHISFEVSAMEHIFLKGKSGAGKSTICKILIKELEDYQGDILIHNQNLKDLSLSIIRKNIVYLSQKENIMRETIKENILFGREISNNVFLKVCDICQIEGIVRAKPLRYETTVDNYSLSGGEKQRIILARAIISKASIYLLDECLSEVEEKREKEIIKNLREFLKEKTIIYISHRNNTKLFERVIEIENK